MPLTIGLIVLAVVVLAVGALWLRWRANRIPDRIETFGPFEVVTHTSRYMTGWNTGSLGTATSEHYSLRFHGQAFAFDGKAGLFGDETKHYEAFNAIITFPSPEPAVVVNVGDPNNSSFFYLVREEGGEPVARYVGDSTGGVSAGWLDPPADDVPREKSKVLHRGHFEGGRWLLLGELAVLDTASLKTHALQPAEDFSVNDFKPAIAMSPTSATGASFARFGYSIHAAPGKPMLAVFEIEDGTSYTLPIDRGRMRYNEWVEIDAAWLDHHFEWKNGALGF